MSMFFKVKSSLGTDKDIQIKLFRIFFVLGCLTKNCKK